MPKFFTWKVLVALAAALMPAAAFAQSSLFGSVDPDDISVRQFLAPLFGELVGEGGSDPLVSLLSTFNGAMLVLAGVLVLYTLVAGTLSTAHDGEMLGKRWSSLWIPIRTTLGAAAITPAIGGGYCVIQALVMWLALQGVGMANSMWNTYLDVQDPVSEAFYSPPGANRQIRETFNDMFMSNVCTASMRKTQSLVGEMGAAVGLRPLASVVTTLPDGYAYGPMGSLCGEVRLYNPESASGDPIGSDSPATAAALVDAGRLNASLRSVHQSNMASAQAQLQALADQLVEGELSQASFDSMMNALVTNYTNELRAQAKAEYEGQKAAINARLKEGMRKDGWAMAGMYYMAIVRAQDEITRAITQTPASASGELRGSGSGLIDFATQGVGAAASAAINAYVGSGERSALLKAGRDMVTRSSSGSTSQVEAIADDATGRSWVMKVVSWFMNDDMVLAGKTVEFAQQGQNPIIMAKNLGENMTAGAWTALGIGGSVLALSGVGILGNDIGDWATVFTPVLFALFGMFVVPGATLSTYVPMIPYILWVGVVIGWIILVIEAIIGSPIWAVAHMAPDGDGVVGRGGQGYMLVLSLVLRPPLMVLGLACSIALMKPIGYFINSTFLGAFAMGVNPGPLAITQAIAGCVLYTVVMISVIHRVFTLIHVIPDRILRWIGGGGNELGEQAQSVEQMSAGKAVAALGATQQIGNLTQSGLQGARDLGRKKADQANAGSIRAEESRSRMAQVEANENDQAYRASMEANRASSRAESDPSNPEARQSAAMSNGMARDARLGEAETKLDHYLQQSGMREGLEGVRAKPMAEREQMAADLASTNPGQAAAVDFANRLDKARGEQASNPQGDSMQRFLGGVSSGVRQQGHQARSWETAAARSVDHERERRMWSQPQGGGGGTNDTASQANPGGLDD